MTNSPTPDRSPDQEGTRVADKHTPHPQPDTAAPGATTENPDPATPRPVTGDGPGTADTSEDTSHHQAVSVWTTAQTSPVSQRKTRYVPDSVAHPAKMLPAIAAHAITHYSQPGDLVLDPMCGIGTTLVEALHAGRRALGVEYEHHWAEIAEANIDLARQAGITHEARIVRGDARQLATLLPNQYAGQVALVVTSPPYGPSAHGRVTATPGGGVHKTNYRYGNVLDRGNLANIGHHRLLAGFTRVLAGLVPFLRPGGHVVITARPWREHAELIDLPSQILACGVHAGLIPTERCVALLARADQHHLIARSSFFQRHLIQRQRAAGVPLHLIAHEDVLIFRNPGGRAAGADALAQRPHPLARGPVEPPDHRAA